MSKMHGPFMPQPRFAELKTGTPACDKHLDRTDDPECPWCKLDEERQYSERMLAAYQEAHRQATENGAAYHALASRLDSAENAMREVVSHLQRSQRGSTHWAGCPDVHPVCQAIDMLVDALPLRDVERHVTNEETQ